MCGAVLTRSARTGGSFGSCQNGLLSGVGTPPNPITIVLALRGSSGCRNRGWVRLPPVAEDFLVCRPTSERQGLAVGQRPVGL
ncbi:uncharacterized protein LY79DRAFT_177927 [Colletotrichum navitas]|uniref:Uncharacterized protein n=1 Tax=Colletotrichum navitas TaxID=681940 RepID=A0AAD8PIM7_9PEZI|nr:uncharacterized protein LY79DRAFT_177927 [Colletotrichum navitas]KAK1561711.1 hypothetical protein LY79DRAFT_177927 [Colletotrichum navitas]